MRPETLALTFTKRLGLTSPEAVTVEIRSARTTFWVWTVTRLRRSLVTLTATIATRTRAATTIPTTRVRFDATSASVSSELWSLGGPLQGM